MRYFPISLPFLLAFAFAFALLVFLIEIGILRYAYHKIGMGQRHMFGDGIFVTGILSVLLISLIPEKGESRGGRHNAGAKDLTRTPGEV